MMVFCNNGYEIYRLNTKRCACYVIRYNNRSVLIDTSMKFELKKLLKGLRDINVEKLDAIFITHNHSDHVANAQVLSMHYNCPVYVDEKSKDGLQAGRSTMPRGVYPHSKLIYKLATTIKLYDFTKFTPCSNVKIMEEGTVKHYLGEEAYLLKTPGHSADSLSFIICDTVAIVGDSMVNMFGRLYPPFADEKDMVKASWIKLLQTNCKYYCPAHGKPVLRNELSLSCHNIT